MVAAACKGCVLAAPAHDKKPLVREEAGGLNVFLKLLLTLAHPIFCLHCLTAAVAAACRSALATPLRGPVLMLYSRKDELVSHLCNFV